MKKIIVFIYCAAITSLVQAQKNIPVTDTLFIEGKIKSNLYFTTGQLAEIKSSDIPDLPILDHTGAIKRTVKGLKGFLLKQLLEKAELTAESAKLNSEFYFVLVGSDGYKVVYSWNELFNTETGNHVYIVTSKEGVPLTTMDERILVLSDKDFKTGRRYVKSVKKIIVGRVE